MQQQHLQMRVGKEIEPNMIKDLLRQYRPLNHEINMIQEQINRLSYECVVVSSSDSEFPYCPGIVKVGGYPDEADQKRRRELEQQKEKRQNQIDQIDNFIDSVDDSLIRQLLVYRYKDGLRWNEIAAKLGCEYSADYLRITLDRFLKSL